MKNDIVLEALDDFYKLDHTSLDRSELDWSVYNTELFSIADKIGIKDYPTTEGLGDEMVRAKVVFMTLVRMFFTWLKEKVTSWFKKHTNQRYITYKGLLKHQQELQDLIDGLNAGEHSDTYNPPKTFKFETPAYKRDRLVEMFGRELDVLETILANIADYMNTLSDTLMAMASDNIDLDSESMNALTRKSNARYKHILGTLDEHENRINLTVFKFKDGNVIKKKTKKITDKHPSLKPGDALSIAKDSLVVTPDRFAFLDEVSVIHDSLEDITAFYSNVSFKETEFQVFSEFQKELMQRLVNLDKIVDTLLTAKVTPLNFIKKSELYASTVSGAVIPDWVKVK